MKAEKFKTKGSGKKKKMKRKASLQSEERQAESSTSLACEMHLNQSYMKSHQWQFWKKYKIISQVTVPVIISWSLKSAMLLCFHSLTKHTWITCSQTQNQHTLTQQCELGLYEKVLMPCSMNMVSAWSLKAVSGHRALSGCSWAAHTGTALSKSLPPGQGAQRFCISSDGKNFCIFQQNHLPLGQVTVKLLSAL